MKTTNIILHHGSEGNAYFTQVYFKKPPLDIEFGEGAKSITFESKEKGVENLGLEVTLNFDKDMKIFGIEIHSKKDIVPEDL